METLVRIHELREPGFHQLLNIHEDKRGECWGFKIKGWWRKGDIRTTKPRKSFECWVKTTLDVPIGSQKSLTQALTGLLGAFGCEGTYTAGDGSCDPQTKSMATPLTHEPLQEQRFRESSKVGREEEGLNSNRPELVALREFLETHDDHIDLLYLTDSEATLQSIHKWIGGGSKLNLSRSPDADVLKDIILKLQKRVETGATTLLITELYMNDQSPPQNTGE